MTLRNTIEERNLNAYNVLIATLLAEFWNYGFINQGTLNIITEKIANALTTYHQTRKPQTQDHQEFNQELIQKVMKDFINDLNPFPEPEINEIKQNTEYEIKIDSSKCRFCPKGVGQAEIPGTLCMFPSLTKNLMEKQCSNIRITNTNIEKKEGKCRFTLKKDE